MLILVHSGGMAGIVCSFVFICCNIFLVMVNPSGSALSNIGEAYNKN